MEKPCRPRVHVSERVFSLAPLGPLGLAFARRFQRPSAQNRPNSVGVEPVEVRTWPEEDWVILGVYLSREIPIPTHGFWSMFLLPEGLWEVSLF